MEEVGGQVASPIFIHQSLSPMGRKRNLYHHQIPPNRLLPPSQPQHQQWSSNMWDWDSRRFEAKPVEESQVGEEERRGLDLNLGSCLNNASNALEEEAAARPSKKGRSGSPGNYPVCQVDNCSQDLSHGKDYHRRHKVCEVHSKATKALVGKQMQRFCQQCSRLRDI